MDDVDKQDSPPEVQSVPETSGPPVPSPDPHAARRQTIKEEDGTHKAWAEEARKIKTIEEFVVFHDKLMNTYNHDYGTICHALAALGLAGTCLANHDKVSGGITGYQAGAVMWEWIAGWGTGPKQFGRMLDYENLLYPQHEYKFTSISKKTWEWLQKTAAERLAEVEDPGMPRSSAVLSHFKSIVAGVIPFGLTVKED